MNDMEAGARATDFSGAPIVGDTEDTFLVTNGTSIHDFLVEQVTRPLAGV